jgi:hypothetical protein
LVTFDDAAPGILPQFTLIADGTYKPTDYKTSDTFFSPAPVAPYSKTLSVFNGANPNGLWSLYVQDDQAGDTGVVSGGWVLALWPYEWPFAPINVSMPENTETNVIFTVGFPTTASSNLIVSASNSGDIPPGLVGKLTLSGTGSQRALTISPAANLPSAVTNVNGTSTITVSVTDGTMTNSTSFLLTVVYVNQRPTIFGLSDQTTAANVPLTVNFTVNDVDDPVSNLVVTASVSTSSLGSVLMGGSDAARNLTYTPLGLTGTNRVSVMVSDGVSVITNAFNVIVTNGVAPVVSAISSQTIPKVLANTVLNSAFTVYTGPLGATNLQVLASADNTNLVPSVVVTGSGSNYTAAATVAALTTGIAHITVVARDEYGFGTNGFAMSVISTSYPPTLVGTLSGGQLHITLTGSPDASYGILTSPDLKTWTDAGLTIAADASGVATTTIPLPAARYTFARAYVK